MKRIQMKLDTRVPEGSHESAQLYPEIFAEVVSNYLGRRQKGTYLCWDPQEELKDGIIF